MLPPLGPCGHREAPPRAAVACAPRGAATSCAAAKRCGRGPLLLARVLRQAKRRCRRGLLCVPLLVLCTATKSRHPLPRRSASAGGAARPCRAPPRSAPWSGAMRRWWSVASPPHPLLLLASIHPLVRRLWPGRRYCQRGLTEGRLLDAPPLSPSAVCPMGRAAQPGRQPATATWPRPRVGEGASFAAAGGAVRPRRRRGLRW